MAQQRLNRGIEALLVDDTGRADGAVTLVVSGSSGGGGGTQDVAVTNFPATQTVAVSNFPASQPVAVSNFPATQAVAFASEPTVTARRIGLDSAPGVTSVAANVASGTILAANANRQGCSIFNRSTQELLLKMGASASASSFSVAVAAGGYFEPPVNYRGIITGLWSGVQGAGSAKVTEYL